MSERYITLLGAEDVQRAANTISSAAGEMKSAAGNFNQSVHELGILMERFEISVQELKALQEATK